MGCFIKQNNQRYEKNNEPKNPKPENPYVRGEKIDKISSYFPSKFVDNQHRLRQQKREKQ
jgi:hypothetical protein